MNDSTSQIASFTGEGFGSISINMLNTKVINISSIKGNNVYSSGFKSF